MKNYNVSINRGIAMKKNFILAVGLLSLTSTMYAADKEWSLVSCNEVKEAEQLAQAIALSLQEQPSARTVQPAAASSSWGAWLGTIAGAAMATANGNFDSIFKKNKKKDVTLQPSNVTPFVTSDLSPSNLVISRKNQIGALLYIMEQSAVKNYRVNSSDNQLDDSIQFRKDLGQYKKLPDLLVPSASTDSIESWDPVERYKLVMGDFIISPKVQGDLAVELLKLNQISKKECDMFIASACRNASFQIDQNFLYEGNLELQDVEMPDQAAVNDYKHLMGLVKEYKVDPIYVISKHANATGRLQVMKKHAPEFFKENMSDDLAASIFLDADKDCFKETNPLLKNEIKSLCENHSNFPDGFSDNKEKINVFKKSLVEGEFNMQNAMLGRYPTITEILDEDAAIITAQPEVSVVKIGDEFIQTY